LFGRLSASRLIVYGFIALVAGGHGVAQAAMGHHGWDLPPQRILRHA
jgi:hypothetical protein